MYLKMFTCLYYFSNEDAHIQATGVKTQAKISNHPELLFCRRVDRPPDFGGLCLIPLGSKFNPPQNQKIGPRWACEN